MYCQKCEFEFKQDISECPICGGTLSEHPEEGTTEQVDSSLPDQETADSEKLTDTAISELLLNAKQEIDALDSEPADNTQQVEPLPDSRDHEPMFSGATAESAMSDTLPDMSTQDDEVFLLDDNLFNDETDTPPDTARTTQDSDDPDRDKLESSLDSLVIPPRENAFVQQGQDMPPIEQTDDMPFTLGEPTDTAAAIDDQGIKNLENSLDSVMIPSREGSSSLPWQVEKVSSPIEQIDTIPFTPEEFQEQPDDMHTADLDSVDSDAFDLAATEDEESSHCTGSRSKKPLILILLLGILLIAAAYLLGNYFLQKPVPNRTKEPMPTRVIAPAAVKKTPASIPAPETQPQTPAATLTEKTAPEQKPEPIATEKGLSDTNEQKIENGKTIAPVKKPEPAAEPAASRQTIPDSPDRQQSSAKRPYSVHVYSFKAQRDAQDAIKRLTGLGFDAYLATVELGDKGTWHRVKVGHYATRAEATQAAQAIKQKIPRITPQILRNR